MIPDKPATNENRPLSFGGFSVGWMMILGGVGFSVNGVHIILTRTVSYGLLGREDYTIADNVRICGGLILVSLFFAIAGVGVLRRWRWVRVWVLVITTIAILVLWNAVAYMV